MKLNLLYLNPRRTFATAVILLVVLAPGWAAPERTGVPWRPPGRPRTVPTNGPCERNVIDPQTDEWLISACLGSEAYSASGVYGVFRPELAFSQAPDAPPGGYWNGGGYPPGWIEVDLQRQYPLSRVRLVVAMLPDGETSHEVWCSDRPIHDDLSGARRIGAFGGYTHDRDRLELKLPSPVVARFVQIRTTRSPSWVAWMQVQVFAKPST